MAVLELLFPRWQHSTAAPALSAAWLFPSAGAAPSSLDHLAASLGEGWSKERRDAAAHRDIGVQCACHVSVFPSACRTTAPSSPAQAPWLGKGLSQPHSLQAPWGEASRGRGKGVQQWGLYLSGPAVTVRANTMLVSLSRWQWWLHSCKVHYRFM